MSPYPARKPFFLYFIFLAGALLLQGCASMSEKECLTVNWGDKGYSDGRRGYTMARVEDHREACAKVGVAPDMARYAEGHAKGILAYCTPENGLKEGLAGSPYRQACPAHLERDFLRLYSPAYRVYQAEKRLDDLDKQSSNLQYSLRNEKKEERRKDIRRKLRDLDQRIYDARSDLRRAERRLHRVEDDWR